MALRAPQSDSTPVAVDYVDLAQPAIRNSGLLTHKVYPSHSRGLREERPTPRGPSARGRPAGDFPVPLRATECRQTEMRCHDGVNREEVVLAGPVLGHNGAPRRDEEVASFLYEGSLSVGQRLFANAILGDILAPY